MLTLVKEANGDKEKNCEVDSNNGGSEYRVVSMQNFAQGVFLSSHLTG